MHSDDMNVEVADKKTLQDTLEIVLDGTSFRPGSTARCDGQCLWQKCPLLTCYEATHKCDNCHLQERQQSPVRGAHLILSLHTSSISAAVILVDPLDLHATLIR